LLDFGASATDPDHGETMDELLDPDTSHAYLRDWQQRAERNAENARTAADRIAAIRATARDGNDLTEVTVDSTGTLLDIRFTDRIHRVPPDAVARAVLAASAAARLAAAGQSREIVTETLGPDSAAAQAITAQIDARAAASGSAAGSPAASGHSAGPPPASRGGRWEGDRG
jgi:DNA-binding protein YbaB